MSYATIEELRSQLGGVTPSASTVAYAEKMMHRVPDAPVLDREAVILEKCRGKHVLEFGASGPLHDAIVKVATAVLGVDREDADGVVGFDLDDVTRTGLPGDGAFFDIIVCGEVIEHLSNPGWFLTRLKRIHPTTPVVISVPNAFSAVAAKHNGRGTENVNIDHVAWYSYRTLLTLLERHGFTSSAFAWYRGEPLTAEGLLVVTE